jgi:anti-sigma factor (TIGR02949 family)
MTSHDRFTCEEAFRRLDDFLDRQLNAEEMALVQSHLEICAGCASEFEFESSVMQGVKRKLRQIDVPTRLQARILAAIERESAGED